MKICKTREELSAALAEAAGCTGFVPTMGALHKGHLSLIERARGENNTVVASVFVNPIQFNNPNDLANYPRTFEADCALLEKAGCDIVFAPNESEMYSEGKDVAFAKGWGGDFGGLDKVMEGAFRPGHFNGVAVVVKRLFELVKPTVAYFGKKDFQQTVIIKEIVSILGLPVRIEVCPIVREFDGLAMSSRNALLTHEGRIIAPQICRIISDTLRIGGSAEFLKARVIASLEDYFKVDYFEIVDRDTLKPVPAFWVVSAANGNEAAGSDKAASADCRGVVASSSACNNCSGCDSTENGKQTAGSSTAVACVAVWFENVRLIDNFDVNLRLGPNTTPCAGSCSK
ncbi:MAG: pantoate--beta-alanine ligase [Bacteroidales bacterium]|jgi:pantoate--beta-alanine ligase|nr:pantoate--beta-alanine ligase [Bacteroidales bacterium]